MIETEETKSSHFFESNVPSAQISVLKKLKNSRVSNLVRYSWEPLDEVVQMIEEDLNIPASSLFRRGLGCLLITLESGLIVGFADTPSEGSVAVWVEQSENGEKRIQDSVLDDEELYPIDALDESFSEPLIHSLVGEEIMSVNIIRDTYLHETRGVAGEVGIILKFKNDSELIVSRNLCSNINDFDLILRDEIDPEIVGRLEEIPV
jgi:hypothetical protein